MAIINRIGDFQADMTAWRQDLHAHPETAFEEQRTAALVAERLRDFGVDEVHTGIATTGVVGVLRAGSGGRAIGLRADMDALPIHEATGLDYASTTPGKMHACGHDGHTTMLLGAARYLAETRNFDGTIYLIFQPGEEMAGGGRVMIEEGLFERFPAEQVFGMHNWPGLPVGSFAVRKGPVMAAADRFTITLTGAGGHAAMPHQCRDPVVAAAHVTLALQSIVARQCDPIESAVLSVTRMQGGDAFNVIPEEVVLAGTVRAFVPGVRALLERRVGEIARGIGECLGVAVRVDFQHGYPATVNAGAETDIAAEVAAEVAGDGRVETDCAPVMGAEDFAFMLEQRPGSYLFVGNGGGPDAPMLHSPTYNFNDEALAFGASYWVRLAERLLPAR